MVTLKYPFSELREPILNSRKLRISTFLVFFRSKNNWGSCCYWIAAIYLPKPSIITILYHNNYLIIAIMHRGFLRCVVIFLSKSNANNYSCFLGVCGATWIAIQLGFGLIIDLLLGPYGDEYNPSL